MLKHPTVEKIVEMNSDRLNTAMIGLKADRTKAMVYELLESL
jgi:hypothetical protein